MVLLTTTSQILDLISSLPTSALAHLQSSFDEPLPTDTSTPISHSALIALSYLGRKHADRNENTSTSRPGYSLNALLRSTKIYKPPPSPKPAPSPEYTALMTRLRTEAEQRQYRNLVSQSEQQANNGSGGPDEEDPLTPSLVFNIFLSVVCCGFAVFWASRWWASEAVRVLLSFVAAIVVGIAEVVVYAAYVRNVKKSRVKERKKKERKIVIGEFGAKDVQGFDGEGRKIAITEKNVNAENDDEVISVSQADIKEEIIWGKGKHGGMRRRVRERWEKSRTQIEDPNIK